MYSGITSVSDTVFDHIVRLMKHAILVRAYQEEIIRTADSTGKAQMSKDLALLEESFAHAAEQFNDARRTVSKLRQNL
jgi:Tfp pilus assembly protein PilE